MTAWYKKLNRPLYMLALTAGILFFCGLFCAFTPVLPKNIKVNGIEVGGLTKSQATKKIRKDFEDELKGKELKICTKSEEYIFRYPEISYKDDLKNLLKSVKKGGRYTAEFECYLCGLNEIVRGICIDESVLTVEPYAVFNREGAPFTYYAGCDGISANEAELKRDILNSLNGGFEKVVLKYTAVKRTKTLDKVKEETALLSSFTTYFDGGNLTRTSNIRLASASLNGSVIEGGKVLSFNKTVGARVKERGYLPAKIIEGGEFVEGVGGGVCQVSTTLYNCALLAGLNIAEYHPHSLAVGYVPPSRDAMVSGSVFDLKIENPSRTPVYVRAQTGNNFVSFKIYGAGTGASYELSSSVTGSLPAPKELTKQKDKAREGKDGILSNGYLTVKRGNETKITLIRQDRYAPVKSYVYDGNDGENGNGEKKKQNI